MGNEEKRMNEKTAILNVRMLGDFSITYDGRQVSFGKNTTTKAMKLLQILIYYGEQGIARENLLNALYVREELADAANNLRVTAHRLKKMIIDAGLPEYDYIVIKKGVYRWNAPVPTIVDARKFQELYEEAQNCADTKQKEELLKQVCNMYRGEFLPEISGDEWVLLESVQYKKLYSNALKELCDGLIEKCDYEEALLFCEPACRLYPFDEWQSIKIECFLVPGHTWGHMVYLIDDRYLFTGDTIWFGADGGYSFISALAESNKLAVKSLAELEQKLRTRGLRPVILTGHTGWTDDLYFAFAHRDKLCSPFKKKVHDPSAPYDAYDESDDTEENAKRGFLPPVQKI